MMSNTLENLSTYGELLEDRHENSPGNSIHNLSSHIINIRDFVSSNINLNPSPESNVSNDYFRKKRCSSDVSTSDHSSSPSVNACEKEIQFEQQNSLIFDKLHDLEILIHQEKINNTKNFIDLQNEIIKLNVKNKKLAEDNTYLCDQLYDIDYRLIDAEQYPRRHNLVISGIPDSVNHNNLEKTVIDIISSIGMNVSSYEVVGCHRLYKNNKSKFPAKTIIRFTNRKVVEYCIRNRDLLLNNNNKNRFKMNLRFYENLCESNERVNNWCRELKKYGSLHDYYTRNGFIKIIINEGDFPIKIRHPDELFHKFQEYFDYIDVCEL